MKQCKCNKCSYEWNSRKEEPKQCPMCKSYKWQEDKVNLPSIQKVSFRLAETINKRLKEKGDDKE